MTYFIIALLADEEPSTDDLVENSTVDAPLEKSAPGEVPGGNLLFQLSILFLLTKTRPMTKVVTVEVDTIE